MFKIAKYNKNSLSVNILITKGMLKRRKLVMSAILNICDTKAIMKVVK